MKSKYDITNLLKTKPMSGQECARIIILNINQDRETGKGFLSQEEIISIINGRKDSTEEYNNILDKNRIIELIMGNIYQNILCYKLVTSHLSQIFQNYINTISQEDVINYFNWIENKNKKLSKELSSLKDTVKNTFKLTTSYVYGETKIENFKWEDLEKTNINKSKDVIITEMEKRRNLMSSSLAYQEIMNKLCEEININYYKDNIKKLLADIDIDDLPFRYRIKILHDYHKIRFSEYDGFLEKEMNKQVKAKYGKEHETFL